MVELEASAVVASVARCAARAEPPAMATTDAGVTSLAALRSWAAQAAADPLAPGRPLVVRALGAGLSWRRGLIECVKDPHAKTAFVLHGGPHTYPLGRGFWALSVELLAEPERLREALLDPERRVGKA